MEGQQARISMQQGCCSVSAQVGIHCDLPPICRSVLLDGPAWAKCFDPEEKVAIVRGGEKLWLRFERLVVVDLC
jgi:hypothetical protein